jgi:hypothetical protein
MTLFVGGCGIHGMLNLPNWSLPAFAAPAFLYAFWRRSGTLGLMLFVLIVLCLTGLVLHS